MLAASLDLQLPSWWQRGGGLGRGLAGHEVVCTVKMELLTRYLGIQGFFGLYYFHSPG